MTGEIHMIHSLFRKRVSVMISIIFLVSIPTAFSGQESIQVTAMIFETAPAIVTVTSSESDPSGGIRGTTIGGHITSAFPPAIVRLKIGGPEDFNSLAIARLIRRDFVFQCGSSLSQGLPAVMIGCDVFSVRDGTFTKIDRAAPSSEQLPSPAVQPIALHLELLSRQAKTLIFEARCTLPGTEGAEEETLLKEIIGLRPSEPILIGFPYLHRTKGKYVYWIALLLE